MGSNDERERDRSGSTKKHKNKKKNRNKKAPLPAATELPPGLDREDEARPTAVEAFLVEAADRLAAIVDHAEDETQHFSEQLASRRAEIEQSTRQLLDNIHAAQHHVETQSSELQAAAHAHQDAIVAATDAVTARSRAVDQLLQDVITQARAQLADELAQASSVREELSSHRAEIERSTRQLLDDIHAAQHRVETQSSELQAAAQAHQNAIAAATDAVTERSVAVDQPLQDVTTQVQGQGNETRNVLESESDRHDDNGSVPWGPSAADPPDADGAEPRPTAVDPARQLEPSGAVASAVAPPVVRDLGARRGPGRPVNVALSLSALNASVDTLARSAADGTMRFELIHAAREGTSASFLRLSIWDISGWWECHDLPVRADCLEPRSIVLGIGEVKEALGALFKYGDASDLILHVDSAVTIGTVLLPPRGSREPQLSWNRKGVERIDLQSAGRTDVFLETQLGRLTVPSRLVSLMRSRRAMSTELVTIDDQPCLCAHVAGPSERTKVTLLAPLSGPGGTADDAQVAERRATRGDEITQLVQALSPDTSPEDLETIVRTGVGYARRLAAAHPGLPNELIEELIRDGTEAMRAAAAGNPSVDAAACERAAADTSPVVRSAIAGNPAIGATHLGRLITDDVPQVRAGAATNANTSPDALEQLALDPDALVRIAVAAHPNTPVDALVSLARDPDQSVCGAVAQNPNCPEDTLSELVSVVPEVVLSSHRAPAALLKAGSLISEPRLRAIVAANPATPAKRLEAMARDDDPQVARSIMENPSTPPGTRRRLRGQLDAT